MSFIVSEVSKEFNRNEFVTLCQDVMTGNAVMDQKTFFQKVTKNLFIGTDPITKNILTDNIKGLYTFLTEMSSHPMRVALSHAMTNTFLDTVRVNGDDISRIFKKYNKEYTLTHDEEVTLRTVNAEKCPYDDYCKYILGNDRPTKGVGTAKIVLIYRGGEELSDDVQSLASGVQFKLNIPFKSLRKIIYVDITTDDKKFKREKSNVFVNTGYGRFKYAVVPREDIFTVKSPLGQALSGYYKMWRSKEAFLKEMYRGFIQPVSHMFFTKSTG